MFSVLLPVRVRVSVGAHRTAEQHHDDIFQIYPLPPLSESCACVLGWAGPGAVVCV